MNEKTVDQLTMEKVQTMLGAQSVQIASLVSKIEVLERDNAELKAQVEAAKP